MGENKAIEDKIARYKQFKKDPKCGRVYVANLPFKIKRQQIIDLFNTVTKVYSVYMAMKGNAFKGYAFVSVEDHEKAKELNNIEIQGRKITVKDADRKEEYVQTIKRVMYGETEEAPRKSATKENT